MNQLLSSNNSNDPTALQVNIDVPGLWLANDWTDTALPFSMESATRSAYLAADAVLLSMGRPGLAVMPPPETVGLEGKVRRRMPWATPLAADQ